MFQGWIAQRAAGLSFIDIGGIGEWSLNETVSTALKNGATSAAMADIQPLGTQYWAAFHTLMAERGVTPDRYTCHGGVDVTSDATMASLPQHDMVHSTGILYHLSDPARALWNLRRITGRWLVTNTIIIPDRVENELGVLELRGSAALFLPGIGETDRAILRLHYQRKFGWDLNDNAPPAGAAGAMMPYFTEAGPSPWPYWFLFTAEGFRGLMKMAGFAVREEWLWEDHAHFVLAEKI